VDFARSGDHRRRPAGIDTSRAAAQFRQLKSLLHDIFAREVD
jgi:hypothetical protein